MKRRINMAILILAVLISMPLQSYAATPTETVEAGVRKVIATLSDPAFKAKSKDEKIAQLNEVISPIFELSGGTGKR